MTFKKPFTLTMPHCVDLRDHAKCELMLYFLQDRLGITKSKLYPETCRVREKLSFDTIFMGIHHICVGFNVDTRYKYAMHAISATANASG